MNARTMAVTIERNVGAEVAHEFLEIYQEAFAPLEKLAAIRQSFNGQDFLKHLERTSVLKYVGWDRDSRPCALGSAATDLGAVPWINEAFFEARWPDLFATQRIYYWTSLLVRPEVRGGPWVEAILEASSRRTLLDGAMVAMDCCRFNAEVVGIPELVAGVADRYCHLEFEAVDSQHFYSYVSSGLREDREALGSRQVAGVYVDVEVKPPTVDVDLVEAEVDEVRLSREGKELTT